MALEGALIDDRQSTQHGRADERPADDKAQFANPTGICFLARCPESAGCDGNAAEDGGVLDGSAPQGPLHQLNGMGDLYSSSG